MNSAKMILKKLIYPPKWVLFTIVPISFATLIFIFAAEKTESMLARFVYGMSAYSLSVLIAAISALAKKIKLSMSNSRALKAIVKSNFGGKYLNDLAFRGGFSIYQGVAVNFLSLAFSICCSRSAIRCSVSAIIGSRCLISVPIPAIADSRL